MMIITRNINIQTLSYFEFYLNIGSLRAYRPVYKWQKQS